MPIHLRLGPLWQQDLNLRGSDISSAENDKSERGVFAEQRIQQKDLSLQKDTN